MDLEIFISEYDGKGCIGLGVVSDEVGMSALCNSMGIGPKELGIHVKAITQAFGQSFTEMIDRLSTKTKDELIMWDVDDLRMMSDNRYIDEFEGDEEDDNEYDEEIAEDYYEDYREERLGL